MSCYSPAHLLSGSWIDAQSACEKNGTHLWTINSHEEWYNVYTKQWINVPRHATGRSRTLSDAIFDPLIALHFFIGLIRSTGSDVIKVTVTIKRHTLSVLRGCHKKNFELAK